MALIPSKSSVSVTPPLIPLGATSFLIPLLFVTLGIQISKDLRLRARVMIDNLRITWWPKSLGVAKLFPPRSHQNIFAPPPKVWIPQPLSKPPVDQGIIAGDTSATLWGVNWAMVLGMSSHRSGKGEKLVEHENSSWPWLWCCYRGCGADGLGQLIAWDSFRLGHGERYVPVGLAPWSSKSSFLVPTGGCSNISVALSAPWSSWRFC